MAIVGGLLLAGLVVAVASGGGDAAGWVPASSGSSDYDWAWDQFYNEYGVLVWRCRGVQTGQFAVNSNCAYDLMTDYRWPGK